MPTAKELREIMPNLGLLRSMQFAPKLNAAMLAFEINTPARQAAFLAQVAHESGEFRYMEEIASGEAYEGRKDLGNVVSGDGRRFKGRGPIQITGRANYAAVGRALGYDLLKYPQWLSQIGLGCLSAAWFWQTHGLNEVADSGGDDSLVRATRIINGGLNGLADRRKYWVRTKRVLGVV